MTPASPAPIRHAPIAFWRIALAFLQTLHALFGGPEQVACLRTLTAKQHALMSSWLRVGEAMMRRLLLIEASAFPKPNTRPLLHARRSRTQKPRIVEDDKPETWRISFRAFAPIPRRAKRRTRNAAARRKIRIFREARDRAFPERLAENFRRRRVATAQKQRVRAQDRYWPPEQDQTPTRTRPAWPMARRYEALLRAFNDPTPFARRIARRLYAAPHRLWEALSAPPEADQRVDAFEALGENARAVWRTHFSSA